MARRGKSDLYTTFGTAARIYPFAYNGTSHIESWLPPATMSYFLNHAMLSLYPCPRLHISSIFVLATSSPPTYSLLLRCRCVLVPKVERVVVICVKHLGEFEVTSISIHGALPIFRILPSGKTGGLRLLHLT